jgi:predicted trehalose synthase
LSATKQPEHLARAEASLKELLAFLDSQSGSTTERVSRIFSFRRSKSESKSFGQDEAEHQELRWWMVAILKRRCAPDDALLESKTVLSLVFCS